MKLQKFDGGLSTRLEPHLINLDQSTVNINIDNAKGSLSPVKSKRSTGLAGSLYMKWYDKGNEWIQSGNRTDFVEFQGFMFTTDGTQPKKRRNGVTSNLGIAAPLAKPTVTHLSGANPITGVKVVLKTDVGGLDTFNHNYLLFNVKNGIKSRAYRLVESSLGSNEIKVIVTDSSLDTPAIAVSSGIPRTLYRSIEFNDFLGEIGDSVELYKYLGNEWMRIGTTVDASVAVVDSTENPNTVGFIPLDKSTISPFDGTYQYVYTYYNSLDGSESAPSPLSDELKLDSGQIQLDFVASTDSQVDKIKLYRVGGNVTIFTLVIELDAAIASYTDSVLDTDLLSETLTSENYNPAPTDLLYLTEAYAMLFGAVDDKLRFTPIGVPDAWPTEYFLQFGSDITGIGVVAAGLLVMTKGETYLVTGSGPFSLSPQPLSGDQGCISQESVQRVGRGMLIWASEDGLCISSGNDVKSITKSDIGDIRFSVKTSTVVGEVYYLHLTDNTTFVWDYRFKPVFKKLNLDVISLYKKEGVLYGTYDDIIYTMLSAATGTFLSMSYVSPNFVEGSYTELKYYMKFYFRTEGALEIKVLIDDAVVLTKALTTKNTHMIKVPQDSQSGYSCSIRVEGTGSVYEIEYEVSRRKNA
tara:strand:+ start:6689 stop:8599 length:1911 start_codon:yes stop_codon:yes gene_type:complete